MMAQWVRMFATHLTPEFDPGNHTMEREPTPERSPLAPHVHSGRHMLMHTQFQNVYISVKGFKHVLLGIRSSRCSRP